MLPRRSGRHDEQCRRGTLRQSSASSLDRAVHAVAAAPHGDVAHLDDPTNEDGLLGTIWREPDAHFDQRRRWVEDTSRQAGIDG